MKPTMHRRTVPGAHAPASAQARRRAYAAELRRAYREQRAARATRSAALEYARLSAEFALYEQHGGFGRRVRPH